MRREPADFVASGVTQRPARRISARSPPMRAGCVQWIDVDTLLPASVRDVLFRQPVEQLMASPTSKTC